MAGRKMTPKGQMAFGGGPPITHLPPAMKAMFQWTRRVRDAFLWRASRRGGARESLRAILS